RTATSVWAMPLRGIARGLLDWPPSVGRDAFRRGVRRRCEASSLWFFPTSLVLTSGFSVDGISISGFSVLGLTGGFLNFHLDLSELGRVTGRMRYRSLCRPSLSKRGVPSINFASINLSILVAAV